MEEQIEKMANDIEKSHWKIVQDFMGCHINSEEMAEHLYNAGYRKQSDLTPCDVCRFNPPSSTDGKPCLMCPAQAKMKGGAE